jgi:nitrogen-specific signal transduction histidine kinase
VSDTGVGVAEQDIPKVFGPLLSTQPTDTGMGLNIVAEIVKRHYGRVRVQSRAREGTTISIDVPPPEQLHALIEKERRTAGGEGNHDDLDPLTVATMRPRKPIRS